MLAIFRDSIIVRNAYKLIPLIVLVIGLSKGIGRGRSLFHFSYAVSVQKELDGFAHRIGQDSLIGEPIPTPETFAEWARTNFRKADNISRDQAIDLWGTPYVLRLSGELIRVVSAGPDKAYDTADDLFAEARLTVH